jgi:inner membrane protein
MASPIGHSLIGCSIYLWWTSGSPTNRNPRCKPDRRAAIIFIVLSNLPDIDFLISWVLTGDPNNLHFGWTHTLVFALIVATVAGLWGKLGAGHWRSGLFSLAAVGSHTVVDFFTGPNWGFSSSYGIPWLAPLVMDRFRSPLTLFVGTKHQSLEQLLSLHNLIWAAYEMIVLAPILLILYYLRNKALYSKEQP